MMNYFTKVFLAALGLGIGWLGGMIVWLFAGVIPFSIC